MSMQNVTWNLKEGCGIVFWRLEERFGRLVLNAVCRMDERRGVNLDEVTRLP